MWKPLGDMVGARPAAQHREYAEAMIARVFTAALAVLPVNVFFVNYQFASLVPLSSLLVVDGACVVLAALLARYGVIVLRRRARGHRLHAVRGQTLTCCYAGAAVFVQFAVFSSIYGYWQDVLLAYEAGIAIAAGLVLFPLLGGAMAYTLLAGAGVCLTGWMKFGADQPQLVLLLVAYTGGTAIGCAFLNSLYLRLTRSEQRIRDKTETIEILLHDFKENSRDIMWQTDLAGTQVPLPDHDEKNDPVRPLLGGANLKAWVAAGAGRPGPARDEFLRLAAAMAALKPFRDLVLPVHGGAEWVRISGRPVFAGTGLCTGYRGIASDVTAARLSEERVAYLARYDSLTDLPNRTFLQESLGRICEAGTPFALLFLDLDGFKGVNDTHGHKAGDDLLRAVAARLKECASPRSTVARLGGDEFVIVQPREAGRFEDVAEAVLHRLAAPFTIEGAEVNIGVSIGVAQAPEDGGRPADLLKCADLALYRAKAEGRGHWRLFDQSTRDRSAARVAMVADLRRAMTRRHLDLAYQPIFDLATGRLDVVEALLRWNDPERGAVSPAEFIPVAEESGLVIEIGAWVLQKACMAAASWPDPVRVAVNFSPVQLRDPALLAAVDNALEISDLPPERLEIEITESLFLDATPLSLDHLRRLRARGIRIALDDFGTGYSSLSYLRSFPFDKVKIDRSFVRDLGSEEEARAIVRAITAMASSLGLKTTAEGVETQSQLDVLKACGCTQAQGFLLARPGSSAAIHALAHAAPFAADQRLAG